MQDDEGGNSETAVPQKIQYRLIKTMKVQYPAIIIDLCFKVLRKLRLSININVFHKIKISSSTLSLRFSSKNLAKLTFPVILNFKYKCQEIIMLVLCSGVTQKSTYTMEILIGRLVRSPKY